MKRRSVAILAGIGAAAIALTLGGVLVRGGEGGTADAATVTDMTSYVATTSGSDNGSQTDLRSQIGDLMADGDFRSDVRALRDKQEDAMDEWWDEYGEERDSDTAREAREKIQDQHRAEMNALLAEYGVDTTAREQAREGVQQAREEIRTLMSDDAFRADLDTLRDKKQDAMSEWWDKYGDDPTAEKAREAMKALRENAGSDMKKLLEKYDIDLPDGLGGRFLGGHGGGLMGSGELKGGRGFMPPADGSSPSGQESTTDLSI